LSAQHRLIVRRRFFRAAAVSSYIVGFLLFLAEYFWWYAFRPMFTVLRTGFVFPRTGLRSRLRDSLLPNRDREGALPRIWHFCPRSLALAVRFYISTPCLVPATPMQF